MYCSLCFLAIGKRLIEAITFKKNLQLFCPAGKKTFSAKQLLRMIKLMIKWMTNLNLVLRAWLTEQLFISCRQSVTFVTNKVTKH